MLTKLMKYEFKATARVMVPLCALAAFLACVAQMALWEFAVEANTDPNLVSLILLVAAAVAMGAALAATVVLMIQRFRSNLLGDEGHVMFTLPVSIHQHIWAKLIVAVLWCMVTMFVLLEFFMILGFRSTVWSAFPQFQEAFLTFLSSYDASITTNLTWGGATALLFGTSLVAIAALCLEIYAPLAIGHSFPKHKMLLSVVFFLVLQVIFSLVDGSGMLLSGLASYVFPTEAPMGIYTLNLGVSLLISLLWCAVLYAITYYMLKHRLNLE